MMRILLVLSFLALGLNLFAHELECTATIYAGAITQSKVVTGRRPTTTSTRIRVSEPRVSEHQFRYHLGKSGYNILTFMPTVAIRFPEVAQSAESTKIEVIIQEKKYISKINLYPHSFHINYHYKTEPRGTRRGDTSKHSDKVDLELECAIL